MTEKCLLCNSNENENGYILEGNNKEIYLCWNCNARFEASDLSNDELLAVLEALK